VTPSPPGIGDPTLRSKVWTVTLKNKLNR